ncbi:putative leucine-rich repeat-containing protein DDB_G0290503 [Mytilus edulis]|uniref:putative leucine-rich repeat-containing protein DDB_G0290503 n=1 Tax=Mytilus edulis TaxID=6550 RepID=UPI0039F1397D
MISIIFVVFGFSIVSSDGFLLDGSTKSPQAEIGISDSHFTTLMKLFLEERESREKLQNFVLRLQQELTSKVDSVGNCNCKGADITDELKNNTKRLQNELDLLQKDFNALQLHCVKLDKRLSTTENTTGRLQHDIDGLKQLKSVTDLQAVSNLENRTNHIEVKVQNTEQSIQTIVSSANARSQDIIGLLNKIKATDNMTLHLENEIKKSNGRLNTAVSDINSRKQDVIALVNKTEATNHQLKLLEVFMKNETHNLESNINNTISQSITAVKKGMMNNVQHLQFGLNDTLSKLDRMSNRVVLSARLTFGGTVAASAVIPFKRVHTSHGINDITSIRNEGKFTCEKPGLYLISVFVATNANDAGYYNVYKNSQVVAIAYRHQQSYVITFTAIVTERLQTNDTVFVRNGPEMYVYAPYESTFSIIQIG